MLFKKSFRYILVALWVAMWCMNHALVHAADDTTASGGADQFNQYLTDIVDTLLNTGAYPDGYTGSINITSSSNTASSVNDYLLDLINQAITNGTIGSLDLSNIPRGMCVGFTPAGNGVLLRTPNTPEEFVVWAYSPDGYNQNLKCTWTCAAGYTRNGNSCVSLSGNNDTPEFDAAPDIYSLSAGYNGVAAWKLVHRSVMLLGYQWASPISMYITPDMYAGTNLTPPNTYVPLSIYNPSTFYTPPTVYNPPTVNTNTRNDAYYACVESEFTQSFGSANDPVFSDDVTEMKAIAKHCVQDAYGEYFYGKGYTTREEFLLMISTLFGEWYVIPGTFTSMTQYVPSGTGVNSVYTNVARTAWYAPYVNEWVALGISDANNTWQVARAISDSEVYTLFQNLVNNKQSSNSGWQYIFTGNDGHAYMVSFGTRPTLQITQL